jgi:AcrR family transcriptional regulator
MPAQARTPRSEWIAAGLKALARGGPDAVRVEPLARELGTTKGSFYWHFDDRAGLLEALLDDWERTVVDDVIAQIDAGGGDARDRLRRLFALAGSRRDLPEIELAIRDWARREAGVARRLKRLDNRRFAYMRTLFAALADDDADSEVRCTLAFSLFVGHPLIAADHPGRTRRDVLDLALAHLLR